MLFSASLTAEAAALLVDSDPEQAKRQMHAARQLTSEAIANALKHGAPARVDVRLRMPDGVLRLEVADDGRGFDPESHELYRHLGLVSMRERAEAIGGTLEVESRPGAGTKVSLEVALD